MKRIQSINGYTIYQSTSQRDVDNYRCEIGNYNIYISADIRTYGLTNAWAEYDDVDDLVVALNICRASNYAIAVALEDELNDSTVQDYDMVLEIERRLDDGQAVSTIREELGSRDDDDDDDDDVCVEYAAELCPVEPDVDEDDLDGDLEDVFDRAMADGDQKDACGDEDWVEWTEDFAFRRATDEAEVESLRNWTSPISVCVYADTTGFYTDRECDEDNMVYIDLPTNLVYDYISEQVGFPVRADDFWWWYNNEYTCDCTVNLMHYAREHGIEPIKPGLSGASVLVLNENRGHASYYVIRYEDGTHETRSIQRLPGISETESDAELSRRLLFNCAKILAFNDCTYDTVEEIVINGRPVSYDGWRPMMEMVFRYADTGEIIYDQYHDEWDH